MVPYTSLYHQYYKRYGGFGSRVSLRFTVLEGTVVSKPFAIFPSEGSEYFICKCLERCWGIAHAKEHD